ncbi:MAG TPA: class I SAM-dependent methyltransferase [bacterium]|nr:class I SAM-dependent methyltransferase [bacterium]
MEGLTPQEIVKEASEYQSVLEVGCGKGHYIRQVRALERAGIDIFKPAIDIANESSGGIRFIVLDALKMVERFGPNSFECVIGLDIVEHFDMQNATQLIVQCEVVAAKCVMFFIPVGNHPQTEDDMGLGNDYYQTHRSTWYPEYMRSLGYEVWHYPDWHKNAPPEKEKGAMCCRKVTT